TERCGPWPPNPRRPWRFCRASRSGSGNTWGSCGMVWLLEKLAKAPVLAVAGRARREREDPQRRRAERAALPPPGFCLDEADSLQPFADGCLLLVGQRH